MILLQNNASLNHQLILYETEPEKDGNRGKRWKHKKGNCK